MKTEIKFESSLNKLKDKLKTYTLEVGFLTPESAEVASQNEFGGKYPVTQEYRARAEAKGIKLGNTITIPARPFMQRTFIRERDNWANKLKALYKKNHNVEESLRIMGNVVKTDIQKTISDANNLFRENSERTIKIKEKNSVLRDSGDMFNSVNFDVVAK